jgi:hypothetical protein
MYIHIYIYIYIYLYTDGWAFLRRRARDVGEFVDIYKSEWDEFVDRETSDFFYWTEKVIVLYVYIYMYICIYTYVYVYIHM